MNEFRVTDDICNKPEKLAVKYMCTYDYQFSIVSTSVLVDFRTVQTVWYYFAFPFTVSFFIPVIYPSGAPEFTPVLSEVPGTRSIVVCVCFAEHSLSFCPFYFDHCVAYSSWIYKF